MAAQTGVIEDGPGLELDGLGVAVAKNVGTAWQAPAPLHGSCPQCCSGVVETVVDLSQSEREKQRENPVGTPWMCSV